MLATGGSAAATVDILKAWGAARIKQVSLIAAPEGVATLSGAHRTSTSTWRPSIAS